MTMGESAGRQRNARVRPPARRRFSDEERAQHTHLYDDPQAEPWTEKQRQRGWRVTRAGWVVAAVILGAVLGIAVAVATRDICWVGSSYGACPWHP